MNTEKRAYFELELDPDPNMTDAVHIAIFKSLGAPQNLTLNQSGNNVIVELNEVNPPLWVVRKSPTPISF